MTKPPQDLLLRMGALKAMGVELSLVGNRITYRAPAGAMNQVVDYLASNREPIRLALTDKVPLPTVFRATRVQKRYLARDPRRAAATPNNCMLIRVALRVEPDDFQRAVLRVLEASPMFGATFFDSFGDTFFLLPEDAHADIEWHDLSAMRREDLVAASRALRERLGTSILNPSAGKVTRLAGIRTGAMETEILLCAHHAVCDGTTMMHFVHQLICALRDPETELEPADARHRLLRLADEEESLCDRTDRDALKALIGQPPRVRTRFSKEPAGDEALPVLGSSRCLVGDEAYAAVKRYARSSGMTPFAAMLAVYCRALFRVWPRWNAMVSFPISMRETEEDLDCPGPRVNNLVLRVLRPDGDLAELAQFVNRGISAARQLGRVPIEYFVEAVREDDAGLATANWFDVRFNYLRFPLRGAHEIESSITDFDMVATHGSFVFKMYLWDSAPGLSVRTVYRTDMVDAADAVSVVSLFRAGLNDLSISADRDPADHRAAFFQG